MRTLQGSIMCKHLSLVIRISATYFVCSLVIMEMQSCRRDRERSLLFKYFWVTISSCLDKLTENFVFGSGIETSDRR